MNALQVARSQLGIREEPAGSNNVLYNTWYYGQEVHNGLWGTDFPWCMVFVQWCFMKAGKPLPLKTASCSALLDWYRQHRPGDIVSEPESGDIVIYDFGHTGIVDTVGPEGFTAVEGNVGSVGEVALVRRDRSRVRAFIRPDGGEENEEEKAYRRFLEHLARYRRERETGEVPGWAREEFRNAVEAGITDGSSPLASAPRYQAAIMALRAGKEGIHG